MAVTMSEMLVVQGGLPAIHHIVAAVNATGIAIVTVLLGIQVKVAMGVIGLALHSIHLTVLELSGPVNGFLAILTFNCLPS